MNGSAAGDRHDELDLKDAHGLIEEPVAIACDAEAIAETVLVSCTSSAPEPDTIVPMDKACNLGHPNGEISVANWSKRCIAVTVVCLIPAIDVVTVTLEETLAVHRPPIDVARGKGVVEGAGERCWGGNWEQSRSRGR